VNDVLIFYSASAFVMQIILSRPAFATGDAMKSKCL